MIGRNYRDWVISFICARYGMRHPPVGGCLYEPAIKKPIPAGNGQHC